MTLKIFRLHKDAFTTDFAENKKLVVGFADINSKKYVNVIAGYITRLVKKEA